jgi:hypothetical protein
MSRIAATLKRYKAAERAQRRSRKLKRKRASKRKSERYLKVTYRVLDLLALSPPAAKISSNHHLDVEITTMSNDAQAPSLDQGLDPPAAGQTSLAAG